MRRLYLTTLALCAFALTANAQIIDDNFDFYTLGPMGNQAAWWTTWSGTTGTSEDIEVVNDNSASGDQAGYIGPGQGQDSLLLLGEQTSGQYTISWKMFVESGATGYFNIQESETPGVQWNGEYWIGATGSGGTAETITYDVTGADAPFATGEWHDLVYQIDLDALTFSLSIDGTPFLEDEPFTGTTLGAMNFFSIDGNNSYWLDDILFDEGILGTTDVTDDVFSVYPNPVRDILNISTSNVVDQVIVYDVLGKIVLQAQPDSVSPSIDMSALQSGAYLVKVSINGTVKTVKVVK